MTGLLLGVVSDRTGYPPDMLDRAMELESDLGIDSIKRVEILSAMQDLVPGLPEVDLTVMASLATLGEITDYLTNQLDGPPEPRTFGRFVVQAAPTPADGTATPGLFDGTVAITDDGAGVADTLAALLGDQGVKAVVIASSDIAAHRSLIHLGNLRPVSDPAEAIALNRDAFESVKSFASNVSDDGLLVVVDGHDGAFGTAHADPTRVWSSGITALARTAAIECPGLTVRAIDIERGNRSPEAIAAAIAVELLSGGHTPEVGASADGNRVTLHAVPFDAEPGSLPLDSTDVVVVSGGGRGVTAATMVELARESSATFVLLGRSALADEPEHFRSAADDAALKRVAHEAATAAGNTITPAELDRVVGSVSANREIRSTIEAIELAGGTAHYRTVDITDRAAVEETLESVRTEVGAITALVHGAGVLADKLIVEKTTAQFDRVFDTKVVGLRNLLDATEADELKVLCLFSSVAARTGNVGQADYAMANDVLNKVAIHERARRGERCVVKSLGWGPWAGGMVTPALERHFEAMGVELIDLQGGARMLVDELSSPQTDQVEVVLGGGVLAAAGAAAPLAQVGA